MEASLSEILGLASAGARIIKDAYGATVKHFGKKKAKALLSEAIRETLKIDPDLGAAWGNIIKSEKFVGKEDIEYIRATSLFRKVRAFKSVRVAEAKPLGLRTLRIRNVTCFTAKVPASTFKSAKYTGLIMVSSKKEKKGIRKTKKRRKK